MKRRNDEDNVPAVVKLYKKNQQDYSGSGGFGANDDVYEERRNRAEAFNQQRRFGAKTLPKPDNCSECSELLDDSELWEKYDFPVCSACNDKEGRHKLITRTEAKTRFLLKDCDLDLRKPPLRFISKKNPHNPRYGDMKLYLLPQLEARAIEVHGSLENLNEALELQNRRREAHSFKRFERNLQQMRASLKAAVSSNSLPNVLHTHTFGNEEYDADTKQFKKTCTDCGYHVFFEKM